MARRDHLVVKRRGAFDPVTVVQRLQVTRPSRHIGEATGRCSDGGGEGANSNAEWRKEEGEAEEE